MFDDSALLLGVGLGLRHATDPDHVAAVSAMLEREPRPLYAVRVAALWGLGHTGSFLTVGLLVVLAQVRVPSSFEAAADLLVAGLLLALGVPQMIVPPRESAAGSSARRPFVVGLFHGLAGSAGVALLATTTIRSALWASLYLGLFGAGTVVGMVALTVLLSFPLGWAHRNSGRRSRWLTRAPGILSTTLGLVIGVEAIGEFLR